jgi:2-polyprenyl-3-methyl-5-hydroxy-6-metoxy-1,4-benzoquinol methylase
MDYSKLVQQVVEERRQNPIDILGIGDADGEYKYLQDVSPTYVRTVRDIHQILENGSILELGAFLGIVSVTLKRMGYAVTASDIPEFKSLAPTYERESIPFSTLNVRTQKLPYASASFDAVLLCEMMEHLNFNPLPMMQEINRVLKPGGIVYIGMPNQARLSNRIKALLGKSIHDPISSYFSQLDPKDNMIVGIHWREYTIPETREILQRMGFSIKKSYFFEGKSSLWRKVIMAYPPFRPCQVVIGQKDTETTHDFWITQANA